MNRDIIQLREVITKLVPLLAGRGLKVTQRGSQAYVRTDPRTKKPIEVNIPNVSDNATPEFVRAIQGFIDHEVAHVLFTDWTHYGNAPEGVVENSSRHRAFVNLHNIIEDTMIEREIVKVFPGSRSNLTDVRNFFLNDISQPAVMSAKSDKERFAYLIVPAMRALADHYEMQVWMDANNYWKDPTVEPFVSSIPAETLEKLKTCSTTEETHEIAVTIFNILHPPAEQQSGASQDKPDQEAGEGDGDGERDHSKQEAGEEANEDEEAGSGAKASESEEEEDEGELDDSDGDTDEEADDGDTDEEADDGDTDEEADDGDEDESDAEPSDEEASSDGEDDTGEPDGDDEPKDGAGDGDDADDEAEASDGQEGDAGEDDDSGLDGGSGSGDDDDDGEQTSTTGLNSTNENATETGSNGSLDTDISDDDGKGEGGGGIGNELSKSMFDFEEDAFEGVDLSAAIAREISIDASKVIASADYKVFTREMDQIQPLVPPAEINKKWIPDLEDETRHMAGKMQKDIERIMASQSHVIRTPGHRRGKLHPASLYRVPIGEERVFTQKQEHRSKDTAVTLLVDNSGSMKGSKAHLAMVAAYALSLTLDRVKIAHEILGFTTGMWNGVPYSLQEAYANEVRNSGIQYDRVIPIVMPVYKDFNERLDSMVKKRIAYQANAQVGMAGNIDGESLEYAAERLARRMEKRKILIVLSDGQPAGGPKSGSHLKYVVERVQKAGIECMGIGIMDNSVRYYYDKAVVLNKAEELPGLIMGEIKRILSV